MPSEHLHLWDLDPDTTYLNHGSFGPSPIEVRQVREDWTNRLERQPMRFFCRELEDHLEQAAQELAQFLHTKPARLALIDNATLAMNVVAASVVLQAGDEILFTDHEYGAVRNIWQEKCRTSGAEIITATLPFPLNDDETIEAVAAALTDKTRVLVVSHVTSATAAILPVQRICHMARRRGIVTVIDGPHAIAMLDVHLDKIGCDFYCASCHKWLSAPFGSGFLWAHPRHHHRIRCPIISWGGSVSGRSACWQDRVNWLGTRDPAALLSIPAAIRFFRDGRMAAFRRHAHELTCYARTKLLQIEGVGPFCTAANENCLSMCAVELPQPNHWQPGYHGRPDDLQMELRDLHKIEIPVGSWNGRRFLRVSSHLYNHVQQIDHLLEALNGSRHLR